MSGLACAKCFKFLRVKKMGVAFEEGMPDGRGGWQSYKLWMADLCECPECGTQVVITGGGQRPLAIQHEADYARLREKFSPIFRVDDCGGKKP